MPRDNYIRMNPGLRAALNVVELLPACFPPEPDADHWATESSPFCRAFIAGGAPRDLVLGQLVKDYDCFWPVSKNFVTGAAVVAVQRLEAAGLPWTFINGAGSAYDTMSYSRPELLGVLHVPAVTGGIDIVFFDKAYGRVASEVVSTFDNSLSRIWIDRVVMDGDYAVPGALLDFHQSVAQRRIWTYTNIPTRVEHLRRVSQKYPGYRLEIVDPELKKQYEAIQVPRFKVS